MATSATSTRVEFEINARVLCKWRAGEEHVSTRTRCLGGGGGGGGTDVATERTQRVAFAKHRTRARTRASTQHSARAATAAESGGWRERAPIFSAKKPTHIRDAQTAYLVTERAFRVVQDAKIVEKREGQEKGTVEYYVHYIGCKKGKKKFFVCFHEATNEPTSKSQSIDGSTNG